jgi:hypothetical protein
MVQLMRPLFFRIRLSRLVHGVAGLLLVQAVYKCGI